MPIVVAFGKLAVTKPLLLKAPPPIELALGKSAIFKFVQPKKVPLSIVGKLGKLAVTKLVQP